MWVSQEKRKNRVAFIHREEPSRTLRVTRAKWFAPSDYDTAEQTSSISQ